MYQKSLRLFRVVDDAVGAFFSSRLWKKRYELMRLVLFFGRAYGWLERLWRG